MPVEKYAVEYNMNHKRRGKAVIFNHEKFKYLSDRPGSAVDVSVLTKTYKALGFEDVPHHNLNYTDIQNAITKLAEEDHSDADCLLVTVLTHGQTSGFLAANDIFYHLNELWLPFTADKCPSLAGKPKIFIIQACRGNKVDHGVPLKHGTVGTDSSCMTYKIPIHADFLIANSCVEGFSSCRHMEEGTWFIKHLCKELQEHASTEDFLKILTRTSRRVAIDCEWHNKEFPNHQLKQVSSFNSTLIRDIYFRYKVL